MRHAQAFPKARPIEKKRPAQVSAGGGERIEIGGRREAVIVPAFDTPTLGRAPAVEVSALKIAVEQGLTRPADLRQPTIGGEQRAGGVEFGLHA